MRRVKIAQLKDRLSAYLRAVEQGEEIEVTDRDRPIARLVPVAKSGSKIRIIPASRPFASVRQRRYRRLELPVDSTALLREERGDR